MKPAPQQEKTSSPGFFGQHWGVETQKQQVCNRGAG